jgi:transposase
MSSVLPSFFKEVIMGEHLLMSSKERVRKVEFEGVVEGRMTIREVSQKPGLSYRQSRRSYKRFREEGDAGLVHRRRGQPSNRARPDEFRRAVLERYRERYEEFGPTFASEKPAGEQPMTAFGKVCKKLGIQIIRAHSPQAKGRVERSNGVYQDRLVKELRLHGITSVEQANKLLAEGFSQELNARFGQEPASETDFHRRVPKRLNLAEVFCWQHTRTLQNDWTIRYNNRFYQILKLNHAKAWPKPKEKVVVRVLLDGNIQILYRDKKLKYEPVAQPAPSKDEKPSPAIAPKPGRQWKPAPDHPWRSFRYGRRRAARAARSSR